MTTTPHHDPDAARWTRPTAPPPTLPAPRLPTLPTGLPEEPHGRRPAPPAVLATRIAGLTLTVLCAFWPALFGLMGIAFGLGLADAGGVMFGAVMGAVAIAWPIGFWFATSGARRVWPVLIALVPTFLVAGGSVWLWMAG
ncbi:hypothetical protein [Pseudonocardia halophobica]|uniref:hypothetical protein n=1 Tax=Pseudonocardia halophobica TaxID=29401 RepID=UPI0012DDD719|nr:hypothetical protein [Pseudonocardia halophobica]